MEPAGQSVDASRVPHDAAGKAASDVELGHSEQQPQGTATGLPDSGDAGASEPVADGDADGAGSAEDVGAAGDASVEADADADDADDAEGAEDADGADDDVDYGEAQTVDEDVYKLKSHRRKSPASTTRAAPREKRRGRRQAAPAEEEEEEPAEPEEPEDPEAAERRLLEEKIDAALKPASKRRKKLRGDDLEQMQDEAIARLREEMRDAALKDAACIRDGQPAVHKIKMLRRVQHVLLQHALADPILDGNLLESVRLWLEPLPDASLPSYEIQKTLFGALTTLPIKTIHLRESGLGRVVVFYQKSKRPHPSVKRLVQKLVGDWTRPIIGRSDNYRDRRVSTAEFDPAHARATRRRAEPLTSYEESAARRNRAALPQTNSTSYQVAPVAVAQPSPMSRSADSQLRRMKSKLMTSARQARSKKSQVSVEGRGLT